MEVTPDMYAWMVSLGVLDGYKSLKIKKEGGIVITDEIVEQMLGGKFIDTMLYSLQEGYNKFYKIKLNYTEGLKEVKKIQGDEIISNSVKYHNWKIIGDVLVHFGIDFEESKLNMIISGNRAMLIEVLKTIYTLSSELMKRSNDFSMKMSNTSQSLSNSNTSISLNEPKSKRNQSYANESINLNNFTPEKEYSKCDTPLEFFIVSLCKNFELKPRQSVALLSNNRKYLTHLCNKGIKGNYEKILSWYQDLSINSKTLTNLLKLWSDGRGIGYATLSVGLYSKSYHVAMNATILLSQLQVDIGIDWDWFIKEGLDSMIFAIIKHEDLRLNILSLMYEFSRRSMKEFIRELNSKLMNDSSSLGNKNRMWELFSAIVEIMKLANPILYLELKSLLIESCLKETKDRSVAISLISDAWINLQPIDQGTGDAILHFLKKSIRERQLKTVAFSGISHSFRLMRKFGAIKDDNAPPIYKTLVFLLLENYDDEYKREEMLTQFSLIFKTDASIPIDIMLLPYFKQIKSIQNYDLSDFKFLSSIIDHPRLLLDNVKDIIEFVLFVCLHNLIYSRCANLVLNLIFDRELLKKATKDEYEPIIKVFINYIKTALGVYTAHVKTGVSDNAILETPYDIMLENIVEVNQNVHDDVINSNRFVRGELGKYSNALLSMMWFYDDHDEVLLQLEEKFAERYEPVQEQKEQQEKEKVKSYKQSAEYVIDNIKQKKLQNELLKREKENLNKLKEKKLHKSLEKQLAQKSLIMGMAPGRMNNISGLNADRRTKLASNDASSLASLAIDVNSLILDEGSLIGPGNISQDDKSIRKGRRSPIAREVEKSFILPISLEDEENRELKAIEGYNEHFKKTIKYYFATYSTDVNKWITKSNIIRLFRDNKIDNNLLTLEELSISIRCIFGEPLNQLNIDQFKNLIIQLSYLILQKVKPSLTISECYGNLLRMLKPPKETQVVEKMNLRMQSVINRIRAQILVPDGSGNKEGEPEEEAGEDKEDKEDKEETEPCLIPPGFKTVNITSVQYNYRIPLYFMEFIPESTLVCFEIVDEMMFKCFNSAVIEPFVKIKKTVDVVCDPTETRAWSQGVTLAYTQLPYYLKTDGIPAADCIEKMLSTLCKGLGKQGEKITPPKEKFEMEQMNKYMEDSSKNEMKRLQRKEEIKAKVEEYQREKLEERIKKKDEYNQTKTQKQIQLKEELMKAKELNKQIREEITLKRKQKKEEKLNQIKEEQEKHEEIKHKRKEEAQLFIQNQQRKLKEQFTMIKNARNNFIQKNNQLNPLYQPLPIADASYLEKEKGSAEFEKNLNNTLEKLMKRSDIKETISRYENHLKVVYDIYMKIGQNKISFYSEEAIHLNEFKEFCINFTILGLLISTEQMTYIFRKICRRNAGEKEEQSFLRYPDFLLSIAYLSLFSRFSSRVRKILPSDIENVNKDTFQSFFDFLGLSQPFNKREVETFINDRRAMSAKQLLSLQHQIKKEIVGHYKENDKDLDIKNEEPKKKHRRMKKPVLMKNNFTKKKKNEEINEQRNENMNTKGDDEKMIEDVNATNNDDDKKLKIIGPSGKTEDWKIKK